MTSWKTGWGDTKTDSSNAIETIWSIHGPNMHKCVFHARDNMPKNFVTYIALSKMLQTWCQDYNAHMEETCLH